MDFPPYNGSLEDYSQYEGSFQELMMSDDVRHDESVPDSPVDHSIRGKARAGGSRKKNFSVSEDILICSAYLNTTKDAVIGIDQPSNRFWEKICKYIEDHGSATVARSAASVKARWLEINKQCGKFIGCLSRIERLNQSGQTEQGRFTEALELYAYENNKSFQYHHCWEVLKDSPKWQASLPSKKQRSSNGANPSMADTVQDSEPSTNQERPLGRKASKELLKKKKGKEVGEGSNSTFTAEFWNQRAEREKERAEREKEKAERHERALNQHQDQLRIEQQRLDMEVLSKDTSNMEPNLAAYYEHLKAEIYRRMGL
ncbi:hypothetical protein Dimus_038247 [Dionaea muscipula]